MMTRNIGWTVMILALTLCTARVPVSAQDAACQTEIEKLCPGMKPGDGKYGQCLVDHEKDFSSPCKKYAAAACGAQAGPSTVAGVHR